MDAKRKEPLPNMDIAVSIHAPVMDAKSTLPLKVYQKNVSIHAPVMDAKGYEPVWVFIYSFNPRARDGREDSAGHCDQSWYRFNPRARDGREVNKTMAPNSSSVSIHAPVMDANIYLA